MSTDCLKLFWIAAVCWFVATCYAGDGNAATNSPPRVTIEELLRNKERWNSNRVEVWGFYRSTFEISLLTANEALEAGQGLWVNKFRKSMKPHGKLKWISQGPVRIIGTFSFVEASRAHYGMFPAEISQIELFEPTSEHAQTNHQDSVENSHLATNMPLIESPQSLVTTNSRATRTSQLRHPERD